MPAPALHRPSPPAPAPDLVARRWWWLVVTLGLAATVASAAEWREVHWVTKPAATLACIGWAVAGGVAVSAHYRAWIVVGMSLGLVGDVALMLPVDAFVPGLAAFLLGHVCYLVAFTGRGGWRFPIGPLVPLGAACGAFFWFVGKRLGDFAVPVGLYAATISLAAWQANARPSGHGGAAGPGMYAFVLSDLILAADRFGDVLPSPVDRVLILATYWMAQGCLAASVGGGPSPRRREP